MSAFLRALPSAEDVDDCGDGDASPRADPYRRPRTHAGGSTRCPGDHRRRRRPNPHVYKGDEQTEAESTGSQFDGWLDDVENFDGVADWTSQREITVDVGSETNRSAFGFRSAAIEVPPGTDVRWRWTGEGGHHNVSDTSGAFESEITNEENVTFQHTFDKLGFFTYECTPHVTLSTKGLVVISE